MRFPSICNFSRHWNWAANQARKPGLILASTVLICAAVTSAQTPTVVLNDQAILQPKTNRIGMNIGAVDYWDSGQILKNLIGSINPGFEPLITQQIATLEVPGTATTFTDPDLWDGQPPNYWVGGTFTVVASQSGGKELGCTGTIASNTGPNYPPGSVTTYTYPRYTTSLPCAAPFTTGDIVVLNKTTFPTPEAWWESSEAGIWAGISGGGKLVSDTTDLCPTCGSQALTLDASQSGSTAGFSSYYDAAYTLDMFVLMNGTYEVSFWAKAASGAPNVAVSASRASSGGFNCGTHNLTLTNTWNLYTVPCVASESAKTTAPGLASVRVTATNGVMYIDNLSFHKTGTDPANTSVVRDEVFNTLKNFYNTQSGGNPGMLRDWLNQNAETVQNWTSPDYAQKPTSGGHSYFAGPIGGGATTLSLEDYLTLCKALNAEPYLEVPVTISAQDASHLIEFLAGPSTSVWGARRAAIGQSDPWTSVFTTIHLSFCNECWNGSSFAGQALPSRNGTPNSEYYYDYSVRAQAIFAGMRSSTYYTQNAFDLVMNAQTAVNYSMDTAIARAHPDSIEIEGYTYGNVSNFSTDQALWQPLDAENYGRFLNPTDPTNYYQSVHDYQAQNTCGATGSNQCHVNVYEFGSGTLAGTIDQAHLDYINAGAGTGVFFPLLSLMNIQEDNITAQSYFSLAEYQNNSQNGHTAKVWGVAVDMGGATNNLRPQYLGMSLVNQSLIGPMYECPISNNATYDFAGSTTNGTDSSKGVPAIKAVPYLYAFCFENGNNRSIVLINTDLTASHGITFSGNNLPAGSVVQRQYAPPSLDLLNESPSGTSSSTAVAKVALTSATLSSAASLTLPPHSVTAIDYTVSGMTVPPVTLAPTFSVPSGTYSAPQLVSLTSNPTSATIYYSTDGTNPTIGSAVYTGPIAVASSVTLKAIALAPASSLSPVATSIIKINLPATTSPMFSPAAGTYSSSQLVTISDSVSSAMIFYSLDGSIPTASSLKYTAPIAVASTSTVKAIAIAPGYATSAQAAATYTIALPLIDFSNGFNANNLKLNLNASLVSGALQLTPNAPRQIGTAWYAAPVAITKFTTDFTFQITQGVADGFTFTIQNSPQTLTAAGGNGGSLGYQGIKKSVAVKFNFYHVSTTGITLNGASPQLTSSNASASGVNFASGNLIKAHVVSGNGSLTVTITDTITGAQFSQTYPVDVPGTVGASVAYVGFTGATGASSANQKVLTWTFSAN